MESEIDFLETVANLPLEGECSRCGKNGHKPNKECANHNAYREQANDAAHKLRSLIVTARAVTVVRLPKN